jgi:hypothetical protein
MRRSESEPVIAGPHECRFVPPDQVHFILRGEFTETHAGPYLDFIFSHGEQAGGRLYCVYDLTSFTRITAGGRERVVRVDRPYPFGALAVIGANFSSRTLAGMILSAGRLLAPKHFGFPHKFVVTMADAAAWFDELRKERR